MRTTSKKTRLNIRVPEDLLEWVKGYSAKNGTCVSRLIVEHLAELKESVRGKPAKVAQR